ncbi:MAG: AAA family ATPase [Lachnospiraceae bacterium]|nr:AAA family ATPase [Lachnospiraceae bacterium]
MILLSLEIAHYGKMKDRTIELRPGVNVITGDNETGKTTIASFVKSMLYGLDPAEEDYAHFLPREADGVFGGALTFKNHDHQYRVERSFTEGGSSVKLVDQTLGTTLSDPDEKLKRMLANLSKESFEATAFTRQESYGEDALKYRETPEKRSQAALESAVRKTYFGAREELRALREKKVGERDLSIPSKLQRTRDEQSENAEKIRTAEENLKKTADREAAERTRLSEDELSVNEKNRSREADLKKRQEDAEKTWETFRAEEEAKASKSNASGTILLILGILSAIATAYFVVSHRIYQPSHDMFFAAAAAALVTLVLIVLGIVFTVRIFGIRKKAKNALETETERRTEAEETKEALETYLSNRAAYDDVVEDREAREEAILSDAETVSKLSEDLQKYHEEEARLQEESRALTEALAFDEVLQKEIRSIEIAMAAFDRLGDLNEEEGVTGKTFRATEYFSKFIPKRGGEIRDHYGIGKLEMSGSAYLFSQLSTGTSHAALLALRLADLDELDPERKVPVILDDVFTHFDAVRTETILDAFRDTGRQVILLSCRPRSRK